MPKPTYRRWLLLLALLFVSGMALAIGFNGLIDPFGLTQWASIEGLNRKKPALFFHERTAKPPLVRSLKPMSILIGASQVEMGLDPSHAGLKQPAYNMAIAGMSFYEAYRFAMHAEACGNLEQIVLGLHPGMFSNRVSARVPNEGLMAVDEKGEPNGLVALSKLRVLASSGTLTASLETIVGQHFSRTGIDFLVLPDGRLDAATQPLVARRQGGLQKMFEARRQLRLGPRATEDWRDPVTGRSTFDLLRDFLALCRRKRIRVFLVITPRQVNGLIPADLPEGIEWRKRLVEVVREESRAAQAEPFPLWDFDLLSRYTNEPLPPPRDKEAGLEWFWDPVHFKLQLGDMILDRVLSDPDLHADFGVRLIPRESD